MSKVLVLISIVCILVGCTMFTALHTVPAPEGCGSCHTVPITSNWKLTYKPPILGNGRNQMGEYFQTIDYTLGPPGAKPPMVGNRNLENVECFACHKSPDEAHLKFRGTFQHP
ncbi:MAG: cytochrome C [Desulfuromonadales bacterium]|nr:cytochrome C [Desulfuromonadales bacterium]